MYEDLVLRFLEHFALIADGVDRAGMWDPDDGFFYDQLRHPDGPDRTHPRPLPGRAAAGAGDHGRGWAHPAPRPKPAATPGLSSCAAGACCPSNECAA